MKGLIITTLIGATVVPALFWIGGWNFDARGAQAVCCVLGSAVGAIISFVIYCELTKP